MHDFLSVTDVKKKQVVKLWNLATNLKKRPISGALRNRNILLLFEKPSTRTRVSFEVGVNQLSGHPIYMDSSSSQLSRGESIEDTAHTLDRYIDVVVARVYKHEDLVKLALAMEKPVVNALSDIEHPCQGLSDLFTINEKLGRIDGVNIAYVGDPNNVFNSLVLGAAIMGARVILASPEGYMPRKAIVDRAEEIQSGSLKMAESPAAAVKDADVVYSDVFVSMGDEKQREERLRAFLPTYQVNTKLLDQAPKGALFMHCLPAHYGEETTKEAVYGPRSIVFDQAENKLHVQKAILTDIIDDLE